MQSDILKAMLGADHKAIASKVLLVPFLHPTQFRRCCDSIEHSFSGHMGYTGFTGVRQGVKVTVIRTGIGASLVGDLVLWLAGGVDHIMLAGSVGALGDGLEIGDYFIPLEAINGEGFSHHHTDNSRQHFLTAKHSRPAEDMVEKCRAYHVKQGPLYTIGSLAAEKDTTFIEFLKTQHIQALDMETSAFYTAATAASIKALAFHFVSDRPLDKPFYTKFPNEDLVKLNYAVEGFPKTVMDILCAL